MEAVTTQWQRIEALLLTIPNIPQPFLNPGATEEEIAAAEAATGGFPFAEDFRFSLKCHNGQATMSEALLGLGGLLTTQEIIIEWTCLKELLDAGTFDDWDSETCSDEGHAKANWWNPRWIPFTSDGCGDNDCLDMDPGKLGTVGQIVPFYHDDENGQVQTKSFLAWLTTCADKLEERSLVWEDDERFWDAKEDGCEGAQDEL